MNFLKTPQELLLEKAGIPHMAKGGSAMSLFSQLTPGAALIAKDLVAKASKMLGRAPNAQELAQIEQHAASLSKPTSTSSGMNLARAAEREPYANMFADEQGRVYSGFSDPKTKRLINPSPGQRNYLPFEQAFESRDPFQTKALTKRTNKGTRQAEYNVPEEQLEARNILSREVTDTPLGGHPGQSTVPANDYIAEIATDLAAKGVPHDYTGMGAAVMGNRPTFNAGTLTKAQKEELEKWRQMARDSGIPESAITSKPSRLGKQFQYLEKEHELGPAGPEAFMGGYADGGMVTAREMMAELAVKGKDIPHLAVGGSLGSYAAPAAINAGMFAPEFSAMGKSAAKGKYGDVAGSAADIALSLARFNPLTVALGNLRPSELGDATLDTWNREQLAKRKANFAEKQRTSPIVRKDVDMYGFPLKTDR